MGCNKTWAVWLAGFFILLNCSLLEAGVAVVGPLTYENTVQPGATYQGSILLKNDADESFEAKIYQTDYLFFANGTSDYGEPGKNMRSNASWITFSPKRVIIPAHDTTKVNYVVRVPNDRPLSGTYWSMLMVEGVGKGSVESSLPDKNRPRLGIEAVLRYGIQIVTEIGDTGSSTLSFKDPRFFEEQGETYLQVDITNTGEKWLRPTFMAELYHAEGALVRKFEGDKMRIYPGTSVRHKVKLGNLTEGKYKVLVVADCGGSNVFGGVYVFTAKK